MFYLAYADENVVYSIPHTASMNPARMHEILTNYYNHTEIVSKLISGGGMHRIGISPNTSDYSEPYPKRTNCAPTAYFNRDAFNETIVSKSKECYYKPLDGDWMYYNGTDWSFLASFVLKQRSAFKQLIEDSVNLCNKHNIPFLNLPLNLVGAYPYMRDLYSDTNTYKSWITIHQGSNPPKALFTRGWDLFVTTTEPVYLDWYFTIKYN